MAPDETGVCCMRVPSSRALSNGGFYHWLKGSTPVKPPPKPEADYLSTSALLAYFRECAAATAERQVQALASCLCVTTIALYALGAVHDPKRKAWAYPMCNAQGQVIGARLRSSSGKKWALKGSRAGIIMPQEPAGHTLLICEGPTDTAAALSLGYNAIGRPSCAGQEQLVVDYIRLTYPKQIVLVADRDEAKERPDGSRWYPGKDGARKLAKAIRRPLRIVYPSRKDLRAMVQAGATRNTFDALINSAKWENLH